MGAQESNLMNRILANYLASQNPLNTPEPQQITDANRAHNQGLSQALLGILPGSGMVGAAGYTPRYDDNYFIPSGVDKGPSIKDNLLGGNYGQAAMQGAGILGDAAWAAALASQVPMSAQRGMVDATNKLARYFPNEDFKHISPAQYLAESGQKWKANGIDNIEDWAKFVADRNNGIKTKKMDHANIASSFADYVERNGFYPKAEIDQGGSVYVNVMKKNYNKDGTLKKINPYTPTGMKVRVADHASYYGNTISIDPISGNTLDTAKQLFDWKIMGMGEEPKIGQAYIVPGDGNLGYKYK